MVEPSFPEWPKIPRLNREIVITEKIDGTNALVSVEQLSVPYDGATDPDGWTPDHALVIGNYLIRVGSRTRWIYPGQDNAGFAAWVQKNAQEPVKLGPGNHYGEWWGAGINKRHSKHMTKTFSLFNVGRWNETNTPSCCNIVPVLYRGPYSQEAITGALNDLRVNGSRADPNCKNPEGIIVYHEAAKQMFKVTIEGDESYKGAKTE